MIALLPSDHNDMELPRAHPRTPGSMNILEDIVACWSLSGGATGAWAYVVNES